MIYPMYALFLLYVVVATLMLRSRVHAVRNRSLPIKYFRTMSGPGEVPAEVIVPARHFTNLFELPVLFYAACVVAMIRQVDGPIFVGLAWAFVACRYLQALIHLTYNNVFHRMLVFFAGFIVLAVMWTLLVAWAT